METNALLACVKKVQSAEVECVYPKTMRNVFMETVASVTTANVPLDFAGMAPVRRNLDYARIRV